jgi:predicted membrane protein
MDKRLPYGTAARLGSLLGALSVMMLVTLYPAALTRDGAALPHGVLMLVMWGLSAGFVHGVGFVPHHPLLRLLLGPYAAWPLLALGLYLYLRHFIS